MGKRILAGIALLLLIVATVGVGLSAADDNIVSPPTTLAIVSGVIATITLGLVLYLLYRIIKLAALLLSSGLAVDAVRPLTILLSLAMAATIFTTGALDNFYILYRFVELVLVYFPRAIIDVITSSYSCGFIGGSSNQALADCIARTGSVLARQPQQFFTNLLQDFRSVLSLVQFFAAWSVLAWILGDLFARTDARSPTIFWSTVSSLSSQTRKRLGLAAIIAAAAYLCLCAIVAVSVFKPAERSQLLSDDAFKTRLDEARLTDSNDKLTPFSDRFPKALEPFPAKDEKSTERYQSLYQLTGEEYGELQRIWSSLRAEVLSEQEELAHRALTSYRLENLNRAGLREQINHSLALENWYYDSLSTMYQQLEQCRNGSSSFLFQARVALADARNPPGSPALSTGSQPARSSLDLSWTNIFDLSEKTRQTCAFKPIGTESQPHRSDFGYTLGIMGTLSIWLLRTESIPLALITGLVGFGLFGALVSTLVRKPAADPTQSDLLGVVARGVSAAIVVFLAAYGGIAIVAQAQTGGDPNPYVVFVTCLVGAVFSDIVWAKAKERFAEDRGTEEAPQTQPPVPAPPLHPDGH